MIFAPRPTNPFPEFIATYFTSCREVFPKLLAIAGKWRFEDLVPGLSDFDTRFVVQSDMCEQEWAAMSLLVGEVHARLAREHPEWARILEHLPGINLGLEELDDPLYYTPQMHAWTWYDGSLDMVQARVSKLPTRWRQDDELYHLKRLAQYWGPYQRGIDPPVNVGAFENKYALHSRYMHYFTPALHSAVSIYLHKNVCGKLECLRLAREMFPLPEVVDEVVAAIECHYETPKSYREDSLADIETRLASYLNTIFPLLAPHITSVDCCRISNPTELRRGLASIASEPSAEFVEKRVFMRLMRGRLLFFSEEIPCFDSGWLIRNELRRLDGWSCQQPLVAFVAARFGQTVDFEGALELLDGKLLSGEECRAFRDVSILSTLPVDSGQERARAREIADRFELVQLPLERLGHELATWRRKQGTCTTRS